MTTTKRRVSLIVPVWVLNENGLYVTKNALDTLRKTQYSNYDVIVVDDCSPLRGTFNWLTRRYGKTFTVVETEENIGATGAFNYGLYYTDAPFVQYQNNDVYFPDHLWLKKQMAHFKDERVGVVGCLLRYPDGTIQHAGAAWHHTVNRMIDHIGHRETKIKPLYNVPFVTGCGMTIRREILDQNGGGLTQFAGYGWDDIDIQVKAKEWGYKVRLAYDAEFVHLGTFSYRLLPDKQLIEDNVVNMRRFFQVPVKYEETIDYFKKKYHYRQQGTA